MLKTTAKNNILSGHVDAILYTDSLFTKVGVIHTAFFFYYCLSSRSLGWVRSVSVFVYAIRLYIHGGKGMGEGCVINVPWALYQ
jgi:hypothetical protein